MHLMSIIIGGRYTLLFS